jgi:adenine nucleotide transporter 17
MTSPFQNPALTYGSFERLKPLVLGDSKMTPRKAFILGALSKTIATIVRAPFLLCYFLLYVSAS